MTEERKKELATFKRRYGHHFIGLLILFFMIGIGYLGWRETRPKVLTIEEQLGLDKLKLSYDLSINGYDGEMFIYNVYFEHTVTEDDIYAVMKSMNGVSDSNDEKNFYGNILVFPQEERAAIMLDLENADDDRFITEIPVALNGINGIERVVINEKTDEPDM